MMKCIDCGKTIQQGFMCDVEFEQKVEEKTPNEMIHCEPCFRAKLNCFGNHPEDCSTMVIDTDTDFDYPADASSLIEPDREK